MDITNIFCRSLGVTSHAKTFLMVCRFRTDLVSILTARVAIEKKLSSVRTTWAICLKKVVSPDGLSHCTKIIISQ